MKISILFSACLHHLNAHSSTPPFLLYRRSLHLRYTDWMKIFILALALLSPFTTTIASSGGSRLPTCKEGSLKRGGGNPGGAVFVCKKGRWEVLIDCCAGESCVSDSIATCTWAKAFAEEAVGVIAGFEISPELVAADIKKKAAAASTARSLSR